MKERPIIFSAPMVRAILDGTKTQTRRVVKPSPGLQSTWLTIDMINEVPHGQVIDGGWQMHHPLAGKTRNGVMVEYDSPLGWVKCPHGQPGDRLWVREAHAQVFEVDIPAGRPVGSIGTSGSPGRPDWKCRYVYRADGEMPNVQWHHLGDSQPVRWTQSIHMPRWASRITLEITDVRVERLQDISGNDALAEGIVMQPDGGFGLADTTHYHATDPRQSYFSVFESIYGPGSFEANRWVWAYTFRRVQP